MSIFENDPLDIPKPGNLIQPVGYKDPSSGYSKAFSREDHIHQLSSELLAPIIVANAAARPTSPATNTIIYQLDKKRFYFYNGTGWKILSGQSPAVLTTGPAQVINNITATGRLMSYPVVSQTDTFLASSTDFFTVPAELDGWYTVSYAVECFQVNTLCEAYILKNFSGQRYAEDKYEGTIIGGSLTGTVSIPLAAGDFISVRIYHAHGAARNFGVSGFDSYSMIWNGPL